MTAPLGHGRQGLLSPTEHVKGMLMKRKAYVEKRCQKWFFKKVLAHKWQNSVYFYGMFSKDFVQVSLPADARDPVTSWRAGDESWGLSGLLQAWPGFEFSCYLNLCEVNSICHRKLFWFDIKCLKRIYQYILLHKTLGQVDVSGRRVSVFRQISISRWVWASSEERGLAVYLLWWC